MKKFALFFIAVFVFTACGASAPKLKASDPVLVDWAQDAYAWHNANLVAECEGGWTVDFKDDFYDTDEGEDAKCYTLKDIVADQLPKDGDVKVDDKVYAEWSGSYYGATVKEIKDGKYSLKYDDDYEDSVELSKIRLKPDVKEVKEETAK